MSDTSLKFLLVTHFFHKGWVQGLNLIRIELAVHGAITLALKQALSLSTYVTPGLFLSPCSARCKPKTNNSLP